MGKKKTAKFPMARIKKIMQADEEVGKLAAAVPVIVSKALELFLESLITSACEQTRQAYGNALRSPSTDDLSLSSKLNGKKLICNGTHLKRCIESTPHFDFLRDLVKDVKDVPDEVLSPVLSSPKAKKPRLNRQKSVSSPGNSMVGSVSTSPLTVPAALPSISKSLTQTKPITLKLPKVETKGALNMLVNPVNEEVAVSTSPMVPVNVAPKSPVGDINNLALPEVKMEATSAMAIPAAPTPGESIDATKSPMINTTLKEEEDFD